MLKHTHHCSCIPAFLVRPYVKGCDVLLSNSLLALTWSTTVVTPEHSLKALLPAMGGTKSHNTGSTRKIRCLGTNHIFKLVTHWRIIASVHGYKWKISFTNPLQRLTAEQVASCTLSESKSCTIRKFSYLSKTLNHAGTIPGPEPLITPLSLSRYLIVKCNTVLAKQE